MLASNTPGMDPFSAGRNRALASNDERDLRARQAELEDLVERNPETGERRGILARLMRIVRRR